MKNGGINNAFYRVFFINNVFNRMVMKWSL